MSKYFVVESKWVADTIREYSGKKYYTYDNGYSFLKTDKVIMCWRILKDFGLLK